MPIILGIDPGKTGGLALLGSAKPQRLIACISVPIAPEGSDDLLDVNEIISFIQSEPPDVAFIERVTPMPSADEGDGKRRKMGATGAFHFGGAVYTLRTCVVGLGIPIRRVEPSAWKRTHGIVNKAPDGRKLTHREAKELSRQKAISLFGDEFFPNIGHHNRAEAALIASHGAAIMQVRR